MRLRCSACSVTSRAMPSMRSTVPCAEWIARARWLTQRTLPSGQTVRYSMSMGAPLHAPLLRVGHGAFHRRGQAHQIGLQHIVGGAVLQRADGVFLADRAGDEN